MIYSFYIICSFIKKAIVLLLFLFLTVIVFAQSDQIDSLKNKLRTAKDSSRINILNKLAEEFIPKSSLFPFRQKDSSLQIATYYVGEAETSSRKMGYNKGIGIALYLSGNIKVQYAFKNTNDALTDYINALPYLKISGDKKYLSKCYYAVSSSFHFVGKLDKSISYYDSAINLFLQQRDTLMAVECMIWKGHSYFDKGDYKTAYSLGTEALRSANKTGDTSLILFANVQLCTLFEGAGLPETAIDYLRQIISLHPLTMPRNGKSTLPYNMHWALWIGGEAFLKLNQIDSAIYLSQFIPEDTTDGDSERFFGQISTALHQEDKALALFVKGFQLKKEIGHEIGTAGIAIELGQICLKQKDFKSAIYYTNYGYKAAEKIHALLEMKNAVGILNDIYTETGNYKQAYHYSQLYKTLSDSLASEQDRRKLSLALIQHELDNQKQQGLLLGKENQLKAQQLNQEKLTRKFFIAGLIALLLVAGIIYHNYKQKQKANTLLEKQKMEIQNTLQELKLTQAQLVQSEKMASLGELTAGIAHEIQNPLNFVNNFSEINTELAYELLQEADKGNLDEIKALAKDIKDNEQKINHHGKRADGIVKSMLQHSRSSSGKKEPTNINRLADEYLKLAYHGLRAKDTSFNASMKTDFDETIEKIKIIPQDIGRVLLNLFNNAFYTVNEKSKAGDVSYQPTVLVQTKKLTDKVEIIVSDNGNGIPQNIVDKIFQPFFTTKPTGQGTGLGLSLSYDIIKAHGGEIKVCNKETEGAEFIIYLPITNS